MKDNGWCFRTLLIGICFVYVAILIGPAINCWGSFSPAWILSFCGGVIAGSGLAKRGT